MIDTNHPSTLNCNNINLENDPSAHKVMKKPVTVQVTFAVEDGETQTLEGAVKYKEDDAILTGVEGEKWTVRKEKFIKAYSPIPPVKAGEDGPYRKNPIVVIAKQMHTNFTVNVSKSKDSLAGQPGDWFLQYKTGSYGIVSQSIFSKTYLILDEDGQHMM